MVTTADPINPSGGLQVDDATPTGSQALSHSPVVSPPVSLSSPWGPLSSVHGARRIFLDICCGVNRPLSNAVLSLGGDCFSFDVLVQVSYDIFDDVVFERLLRICASGIVGYNANSPSCKEYSRLKLKPHGPPALRTPEFLEGKPGISADDLLSVQESRLMLTRCVSCASLTFDAGGHSHLEQPPSAMSWQEPEVQSFISSCRCHCTVVAACHFDRDWAKSWMFCTTCEEVSSLACICHHGPHSHQQIAGVRTESGAYLSRYTAEYPPLLALAFARCILGLIDHNGRDFSLDEIETHIPCKDLHAPPFVRQDGGGLTSCGDWSHPPAKTSDVFQVLRQHWIRQIISQRLDKQLTHHLQNRVDSPPFSDEQLRPFKLWLEEFLEANGEAANWTIPADQPMHLFILQSLQRITDDKDTSLFRYLIEGVPTGFDAAIEPSHCFPLNTDDSKSDTPLSAHHVNWASAEDNMEIVKELVQEEISQGWVSPFSGDLAAAQDKWPLGVAIGKLGLALSEGRSARLVVDSSICGVNSRCVMPDKSTLPTARDILRSYPLRSSNCLLSGFSLDIKSAHKRMAVHPAHRGLLGFSLGKQLYFYNFCPFGAVFSAHFWSRFGGYLIRMFHLLAWVAHAGFLYVDDLILFQDAKMMPVTASLIVIFCQLCRIPISWRKCELGPSIRWIGWDWNLSVGYVSLPFTKLDKIKSLIQKLSHSDRTSRKTLEQFLGLAMWITQLFPSMRTWLHSLYHDLYAIPASNFSISQDNWNSIFNCVTDDLVFHSCPPSTSIPVGGKLIQVRHQPVSSVADLHHCYLSDRRIWLRIRDPASSKRRLSNSSIRTMTMYQRWLREIPPAISIWPKQYWPGICVADAFASGSSAGIGGIVYFPSSECKWFCLPLCKADFDALDIPLHSDLQRDITSLETLAQIALLFIVARRQPGFRMSVRVPALSDNTGAESVSNKVFSTALPLALFLEKLSILLAISGMAFDVTHIPGKDNVIADSLSRWNGIGDPPCSLHLNDRFDLSLPQIWKLDFHPRLCPSDAWIPWSVPQ